jgi:Transposase zinc-binding domain
VLFFAYPLAPILTAVSVSRRKQLLVLATLAARARRQLFTMTRSSTSSTAVAAIDVLATSSYPRAVIDDGFRLARSWAAPRRQLPPSLRRRKAALPGIARETRGLRPSIRSSRPTSRPSNACEKFDSSLATDSGAPTGVPPSRATWIVGLFESGFARAFCPECRFEFLVALSCKGRGLCPSCAAKRAALFSQLLQRKILADVAHAQWVFTLPKMLRPYFLFHRELLGELARLAYETVREMMAAAAGES